MEGRRKQGKSGYTAHTPHNQKCYWRQKIRPLSGKFALYKIWNTSNENERSLSQSPRLRHEVKDWSGEERLNLFFDRRRMFEPGCTGTGVEGNTHVTQYKVCGSLTQMGSRNYHGRACLVGVRSKPVCLQQVVLVTQAESPQQGTNNSCLEKWPANVAGKQWILLSDMGSVKVTSSCKKKKNKIIKKSYINVLLAWNKTKHKTHCYQLILGRDTPWFSFLLLSLQPFQLLNTGWKRLWHKTAFPRMSACCVKWEPLVPIGTKWLLQCATDEQTPFQAGLGKWGKGRCHWSAHTSSAWATAQPPQFWHSAFGVTSVGTGGLVSCGLTQGPSASDVRNGFFTMQTLLFPLTLGHRFTGKSRPPHSS